MNIFKSNCVSEKYLHTDVNKFNLFPWRIDLLPKSGILLDVGCGNGNVMSFIKEYNPNIEVYGIEPSLHMLNRSNNLKIIQASAEKIPFPNNKFDVEISRYSFKWFEDPCGGLQEIYRTLKPSGIFLLWDSGKNEMREAIECIYEEIENKSDRNEVIKYFESSRNNSNDVKTMLEKLDFEIIECDEIISNESYMSISEFKEKWWDAFSIFDNLHLYFNNSNEIEKKILKNIEKKGLIMTHHNYGFIARKNKIFM